MYYCYFNMKQSKLHYLIVNPKPLPFKLIQSILLIFNHPRSIIHLHIQPSMHSLHYQFILHLPPKRQQSSQNINSKQCLEVLDLASIPSINILWFVGDPSFITERYRAPSSIFDWIEGSIIGHNHTRMSNTQPNYHQPHSPRRQTSNPHKTYTDVFKYPKRWQVWLIIPYTAIVVHKNCTTPMVIYKQNK